MGTYYKNGLGYLIVSKQNTSKVIRILGQYYLAIENKYDLNKVFFYFSDDDCIKRNGAVETEIIELIKPYIESGLIFGEGEGEYWKQEISPDKYIRLLPSD